MEVNSFQIVVWCHIMTLTCLNGGTECGNNEVKNRINLAPAVKGLKAKSKLS